MEKRIEEGPPIYIESLLSSQEIKERCRVYATSHMTELRTLAHFTPGLMKWRYKMGANLSAEEIVIINKRIEQLKELLEIERKEQWGTTF